MPGNYRGLAIGSCFAKLFSFILLARINDYADEHDLISKNQIGFKKGQRTSDHIFLLNTIVDKYIKKKGGKLYTAFIDFKKAYDTVNRTILFNRLKTIGINGIFLRNIISLYQKTEYLVTYKTGHLDPIHSNLGHKVHDTKLSHILYADDVVLLSCTKEGIQRCLDKLHDFSEKKTDIH